MKKHRLGDNQHYVAGKRGIRFQRSDGVMIARKPGEAMPEAIDFPNIRLLVSSGRLAVAEKPEEKPKEEKKPRDFFNKKKRK